jgi:hypothetical protein
LEAEVEVALVASVVAVSEAEVPAEAGENKWRNCEKANLFSKLICIYIS